MKRLTGPGLNNVPDTPLGRAWLAVVARLTEHGGKTISQGGMPDNAPFVKVAVDVGIDPDEAERFVRGAVENVLRAGSSGASLKAALTGAMWGVLLTGAQAERDRA